MKRVQKSAKPYQIQVGDYLDVPGSMFSRRVAHISRTGLVSYHFWLKGKSEPDLADMTLPMSSAELGKCHIIPRVIQYPEGI